MKVLILKIAIADEETAKGIAEDLYENAVNADDSPDVVTLGVHLRDIEPEEREHLAERIGDEDEPAACECDNTHSQNSTVCRWCHNRGRRFGEPAL